MLQRFVSDRPPGARVPAAGGAEGEPVPDARERLRQIREARARRVAELQNKPS